MQVYCRLADRVTVKGSDKPMLLYTYDVPFGLKSAAGDSETEQEFQADIISSKDTPLDEFYMHTAPRLKPKFLEKYNLAMKFYLVSTTKTRFKRDIVQYISESLDIVQYISLDIVQ